MLKGLRGFSLPSGLKSWAVSEGLTNPFVCGKKNGLCQQVSVNLIIIQHHSIIVPAQQMCLGSWEGLLGKREKRRLEGIKRLKSNRS